MQSQCHFTLISPTLHTNSSHIAHRPYTKGFQGVLDLKKKEKTIRLERGDLGNKRGDFRA